MKEKSYTQKTTIESLGKEENEPGKIQSYFILSSLYPLIMIIIIKFYLYFSYLLEKHQHVISSSHYNHHDMVYLLYANAFDNENYTG